jgi:SNF2 family DNA or RNA helicase
MITIKMYDDKSFRVDADALDWRDSSRIRRMPEVKWHADGFFTFPSTEPNLDHLRISFKPEEFSFDEEAQLLFDYTTKTIQLAAVKERRRWQYIFNDVVPTVNFKYHTKPYQHQLVGHDAIHGQEFFGLFMEMGTGKTKVVIDEIISCINGAKSYKVLIVAPRSVVRTWEKEFIKHTGATKNGEHAHNNRGMWKTAAGLDFWMCRLGGSEWGMNELIEGMRSDAKLKVFLVNYERLGLIKDGLKAIGIDLMVCDESTRIKSPSARRTKNVIEVGRSAERRVVLTGTPITNSLFDLFSQFEFLQPASLGYTSFHAFQQRFAQMAKMKQWDKVVGYKHLDDLKRTLARHSFIVTKDQCLDLPPKSYETISVEMGDKQRAMYEEMVEWFMASLEEEASDNGRIEARSFLAKLLRLSQITQGFAKTVDGGTTPIPDGQGKLTELIDIIEDLPEDRKILVWARFHYDIDAITSALDKLGIKHVELTGRQSDAQREHAVEAFNGNNNVRVLIGEPGTGGLGLTLLGHPEKPCHTVVYYSNDYSLEKRLQSEDRCHRIGQAHPVTYIDIVCEDSIDQHIAAKLQAKRDLCDEVKDMSSIRALLLGEDK